MNSRLVTAALVAMLAAASAPALIGGVVSSRTETGPATGDPRVGDCSPRCPPRTE